MEVLRKVEIKLLPSTNPKALLKHMEISGELDVTVTVAEAMNIDGTRHTIGITKSQKTTAENFEETLDILEREAVEELKRAISSLERIRKLCAKRGAEFELSLVEETKEPEKVKGFEKNLQVEEIIFTP